MDFNRFTEKAQDAVREAQSKAIRYGNQQVDVEHVLASLLEPEDGLAPAILNKAGLNLEGYGAVWNRNWSACPRFRLPRDRRTRF